jgi:PAS domain S-box-containing protein
MNSKVSVQLNNALHALMEQTPVGIVVVDMQGDIVDINTAAMNILGAPDRETALSINVLTSPRLIERGVSAMFRYVMDSGDIFESETAYQSRWGKKGYVRSKLSPRFDAHERQTGVIQILEDISEQKLVEDHLMQQLAYEHTLAAITRLLLQTPRDKAYQRAILDQALGYLVEAAKVDRAYIFHRFDDPELGECIGLVAEACAPGVTPHIENEDNRGLPLHGLMPEPMIDALGMGKPVGGAVAEMFQELPEVRDDLLEQPLLSTQWFPIFIEGQWWGFVGFDDNHNERVWKEEEIVLLQTVADVFGSTLQRWEAERALQEERDTLESRVRERTARLERRLQIERMLGTAAARLMAREDFSTAMEQTLQDIGQVLDASQVLLVRIDAQNRRILNSYKWQSPQTPDRPFVTGPVADWFRAQLGTREPLYITDVEEHFPDNALMKKALLERGIRAMLLYPLQVEDSLVGVFDISLSRALSKDEVDDIVTMLDIMANLLNGLLQRQILIERRDRQILEQTRALSAMLDAAMLDTDAQELGDVVSPILALIAELSQAQTLAVYELEPDGQFRKIADRHALGSGFGWEPTFRPTQRVSRWLAERDEPLLLNPDELDEITPFTHDPHQPGVGMIVDIRAWQHFNGLLLCFRTGEEQYSPNQVAMTTALADYMSTVIENHLLRRLAENTAIIEERQRLARDLHDSVSQSLYGVMLFARAGRDALEGDDQESLSRDLARVEENALRALKEMRLLLYQLQPLSFEQGGLAQALTHRFSQVEARLGVETELAVDPDIVLPRDTEEMLYRLASEALNNALKHADATRVSVQLTRDADSVILTIADNGRGFDPEQVTAAGMGLANMRFRAKKAGGVLSIESAPAQGTVVRCTIPTQQP